MGRIDEPSSTELTGRELNSFRPTLSLCRRIGGFEPERGSAVAGHRGYFLRDAGLLLNQVRINSMHGHTPTQVNLKSMR
jgi:hypothetical protein